MMRFRHAVLGLTVVVAAVPLALACRETSGMEPAPAAESGPPLLTFSGASDTSAAVAIDRDTILVADDETNVLRVYGVAGGAPRASNDLTIFLGVGTRHPEADFEAAARVGDRVYWIASHGRSKSGKLRENRQLFFATELRRSEAGLEIRGVGSPYRELIRALVADPALAGLGLDRAAGLEAAQPDAGRGRLVPKALGLNIEGLCATPTGDRLYIGFRNPLVRVVADGSFEAIVVALENAADVVERRAAPHFGAPMLWDLRGAGIRSMAWSSHHGAYFVVAGPVDDEAGFSLWRWSGQADAPPVFVESLDALGPAFSPEALVPFEDSGELLVLSDDGSQRVRVAASDCFEGELRGDGTCENKHLRELDRRTFRGSRLRP